MTPLQARDNASIRSARERDVLCAIIEQHIQTAEPVSSRQICDAYAWGLSTATVRNCMARLEATGFLHHPYPSAGKIPTSKAYRYFVDRLLEDRGLDSRQQESIHAELWAQANEVEHMVKLTASVLAALSQLLAVSWVSHQLDDRLERIDLVRLSARRLMLVAFTLGRREIHQTVETGEILSAETLSRVVGWVNEHGRGKNAAGISGLARNRWTHQDRRWTELLRQALDVLSARLQAPERAGVVVQGAANLIAQPEFNDVRLIRRLVALLDQQDDLLQSFAGPGIERDGLHIVIGEPYPSSGLPPLSLVTVGVGLAGGRNARFGVVGPTRMAYGRIIPLLQYTASTVARVIARSGVPSR